MHDLSRLCEWRTLSQLRCSLFYNTPKAAAATAFKTVHGKQKIFSAGKGRVHIL